jgi:ATP-dependent RNA helicase DDX10/DBP4
VLDEADRLLDLGFARTLAALLAHLPRSRQTLLFSATQSASVADLARLSLDSPVPIGLAGLGSVDAPMAMPAGLAQHYAVVPLERKLSVLYSFLRSHTSSKTLVFLSSTKQVRHAFAAFSRLRPGVPLLHLTGRQKTAARGLDFPGVGWVVQADAPGDVAGYVHRAGRTARYAAAGAALLLLAPSEEAGMAAKLAAAGVQINKIKIREKKTEDTRARMAQLAFKEPEVKYLAQRAFVSYMRSVHLQPDKETFKLAEYDARAYAESLGLAGMPKIKFLKTAGRRGVPAAVADSDEDEDEDEEVPASSDDEEEAPLEEDAALPDDAPAPAPTKVPRALTRPAHTLTRAGGRAHQVRPALRAHEPGRALRALPCARRPRRRRARRRRRRRRLPHARARGPQALRRLVLLRR